MPVRAVLPSKHMGAVCVAAIQSLLWPAMEITSFEYEAGQEHRPHNGFHNRCTVTKGSIRRMLVPMHPTISSCSAQSEPIKGMPHCRLGSASPPTFSRTV
jgi:hypothetical protein